MDLITEISKTSIGLVTLAISFVRITSFYTTVSGLQPPQTLGLTLWYLLFSIMSPKTVTTKYRPKINTDSENFYSK